MYKYFNYCSLFAHRENSRLLIWKVSCEVGEFGTFSHSETLLKQKQSDLRVSLPWVHRVSFYSRNLLFDYMSSISKYNSSLLQLQSLKLLLARESDQCIQLFLAYVRWCFRLKKACMYIPMIKWIEFELLTKTLSIWSFSAQGHKCESFYPFSLYLPQLLGWLVSFLYPV